jgi:hypothetical protein
MFQGSLATVALPFLDCFLDSKGEALAATGARIPDRFNTFFFGLGLTNALWIPKAAGANYETPPQLAPLEPFKKKMNVFSDMHVMVDDNPNAQHWTGMAAVTTGNAPAKAGEFTGQTIDLTVANVIGKGTRYKTVSIACSGNKNESFSSLGGANTIPPDVSPLGLYTRLFGPGFQDPSKGDWKPDPQLLLQQSVLSVVADSRKDVMQNLGASDKIRMDQYFTSVRESEQQITAELTRPEIVAKVTIPEAPSGDLAVNKSVPVMQKNVPLMAKLGALGLATDQTRVFNMYLSEGGSTIYVPGDSLPFHQATHEEPIDPVLNYQKKVSTFGDSSMQFFAMMLKELDAIPEGNGTLLDHSMTLGYSETSFAKIHALDGIPMFLVGGGNGRVKTGNHIAGRGDPVSRVGLTIQKAFGMSVDSWGSGSMATKNLITEILV